MSDRLGYGLVGCGGFGRFCLEQYLALEDLECVAVADLDPRLAHATASAVGVVACESAQALLARPDIDLIHIATPPFTHRTVAMAALEAGKHVLCEKPIALTLADARAMVARAGVSDRVLAVNLIMRYNPLCQAVKRIVGSSLLGEPLHAMLVNDARDEPLPPGHWFWDREKSGGIFIEHGVHFFDLFEWWFGPGEIVSARQVLRPGTEFVDQVSCNVVYKGAVLVNFYHGFHQASRNDRQRWEIVFERGMLTMREWVPTELRIEAILEQTEAERLHRIIPDARIRILESYAGGVRHCASRHRSYEVDGRYEFVQESGVVKLDLYGRILRALMQDQIDYIRNRSHQRMITESHGMTSLVPAITADALARALPVSDLLEGSGEPGKFKEENRA